MRPARYFFVIQLSNSREVHETTLTEVAAHLTNIPCRVILPSLTVNRRKNRRIPCIYWAAAIFSLLRTIVIYSFPLLFFWIVLILLLVMNW